MPFQGTGTMSKDYHADGRDDAHVAAAILTSDGRSGVETSSRDPAEPPRLCVRVIERVVIVRFVNSEILFDEADVRAVREQLSRLISEEGHTRILLDFHGVGESRPALLPSPHREAVLSRAPVADRGALGRLLVRLPALSASYGGWAIFFDSVNQQAEGPRRAVHGCGQSCREVEATGRGVLRSRSRTVIELVGNSGVE
jgi:hypothetical protein